MNRSRNIFYIVFILFHVILFVFSLIVERNMANFDFLISMRARIPWMKYVSAAGLLLIIIDYLLVRLDFRRHQRKLQKVEDEKNTLKARMYDMMNKDGESEDTTLTPDPSPSSESNSDQEEEQNGS